MKKLLNKLLEKQSLHRNKNDYYISMYYPVNDISRNNIDTHLKSFITESLRNNKRLSNKTRLHKNIVEKVLLKLDTIKNLQEGCGIFIKFNSKKQEKGRNDEILDENFDFVTFSSKPEKQIFIGNVYSLSQLIWMDNIYTNALVLNIFGDNNCDIYKVKGNQIDKLNSLHKSSAKYEKDFMRVYKPTGNVATTHGTGSKTLEHNEEETTKKFFKEIIDHIESSKVDGSKYKYIVIFHSKPFSKAIEDILKENLSKSTDFFPIFISKNISDSHDLLRVAGKQISEFQKANTRDKLDLAQKNYSHYCEGWKETTVALNKRKISTLFIKPIEKKGYINLISNEIYTYPEKDTVKVKNITPYTVISVVKNGGEIVFLQDESYENSPDIAAELRYAKKRQNKNIKKDIEQWVSRRKGTPAIVKGTEDLLRIKFSDSERDLVETSWNKFFELLDKNELLFIYDKESDSRFNAFVDKN